MAFQPYRHTMRVRYAECDMQGVVYFARYPFFFDVAITELWRDRVGPYDEMVQNGSDMVVAEMNVKYRAPALFDQDIDVVIDDVRVGETSVVFEWHIEREGAVLIEGMVRQVCIDPPSKTKKPVPDDVRAGLS
jgi:acyl-CoA thioester hydrolase